MTTFNKRIEQLELEITKLTKKIKDLSAHVEGKFPIPYSKAGGITSKSSHRPIGTSSGMGHIFGGAIIWNDAELKTPGFGTKGDDPNEAYNRHFHSEYGGGALDINAVEFVEYNVVWEEESAVPADSTYSPHSQNLWSSEPPIKKDENDTEKLGKISDNLVWDSEAKAWKFYAVYKDEPETNN